MRSSLLSPRSTSFASAPTCSQIAAISFMKTIDVARNALIACLVISAASIPIQTMLVVNGASNVDTLLRSSSVSSPTTTRSGLVKTSIDPPPILDILITGRANDEATLKAKTGVSPEVFGAWFTGYGKTQGITAQNDVRIIQPSQGLKSWYDQRAEATGDRAAVPASANSPTAAPTPPSTRREGPAASDRGRCNALNERQGLGEQLTPDERDFLRQQCGSGGR